MTPLYRLGLFAAHHPWRIVATWLVCAVMVIAGSAAFGRAADDDTSVPGLDSQIALDLLSSTSLGDGGLTAQIVATPRRAGGTFFDDASGAERAELAELQARVRALPKVVSTSDPAGSLVSGTSAAIASGGVSTDGRVALIRVQYPDLEKLDASDLELLKAAVSMPDDDALVVEAGGDLFFQFEQPEPALGELAGLLVAVLVLLIAFGSVVAAGLPIITALVGLGIGISSLGLVAYLVEIPSFGVVMASMVGLGAGIDYALFVVTRHREHLADGIGIHESIARSVATAGKAVVFAGGTVLVSILGLSVAGLPFVTAIGIAISVVVAVMVAAAITVLPALLSLLGHRVERWHVGRARDRARGGVQRWERWATHVTRHRVVYGVCATAALLLLAAPVFALRLGVPDEGTLPRSRTERRAYELVASTFGPGVNGPLVIAVDLAGGSEGSPGNESVIAALTSAIEADTGIAEVRPAVIDAEAGVAAIIAIPNTAPQDAATQRTVTRLRSDVFPQALVGSDVSAHVGGMTANFADLSGRVQSRLPWLVTAVVIVSFLLLMVLFRSPVVALKAAVLNLLSIGAAYGVLVMVFQWHWGGSLIGLEGPVPIVSFIPMLMFAIVFGLSMDYEVFLLSRVREHYDRTGDNDAAIVHGLSSSARVITSAALIMVSVFLGFGFGEDPTIKMLGIGLATAILVDATVIRMILVPATMALMGNANWWLPRRLERVLPRLRLEDASV